MKEMEYLPPMKDLAKMTLNELRSLRIDMGHDVQASEREFLKLLRKLRVEAEETKP